MRNISYIIINFLRYGFTGMLKNIQRKCEGNIMKSRTQKAFFNTVTSLLSQITMIVSGLIMPRLILTNFGSTYNGVIASATQFFSILNILTFGITDATRVALYKPFAENDNLAVSRLIKSLKKHMRRVGIGAVVFAIILCVAYSFISENDLTWGQNAMLIATVGINSFASYFFGISNVILLQAAQSTYIYNIENTIKPIINLISVAVLINLGCSIYTVKLGSSFIYFLAPIILSIYIHKKFSLTNKCEPCETNAKDRKAAALHSTANILHDNIDLITLTFFVHSKVISVYTVYYATVSRIKTLMRAFTSGLEAAFGDMWSKKEYETFKRSFRTYEYMLYVFTAVIFSCVGILLVPFVRVYTRGVTDVNYILPFFAILITLAEAVHCIRQPYLTIIYATGNFEKTKWSAVAEAGINLVLSLVLVPFFNLSGVMLATLAANLFCTVMFVWFSSKNILNRPIREVVYRVIWLISCAVITLLLSTLIKGLLTFEISWFGWLTEAIVVFVIAVIVVIVMSLVFYRKDFFNLLKTGKQIFKK